MTAPGRVIHAGKIDRSLVFVFGDSQGEAPADPGAAAGAMSAVFGGLLGGISAGLMGGKAADGAAAGALIGVTGPESEAGRWTQGVPGLSWPLPSPSARLVLPKETGAWAQRRGMTIGGVSTQVLSAMTAAGYTERSFFDVPDGFVVVTRPEQIERDGTAKGGDERWNVEAPGRDEPFLLKVLRGMAGANAGNYRMFIFVVSTDDRAPTSVEPTFLDAQTWFLRGTAGLAPETAARPVTARHRMSVHVYEFEAARGKKVAVRAPGRLTCEAHLEKAGLWPGLSKLAGTEPEPLSVAGRLQVE
ncbi:hypothetical protein [Thauera sinica]|uniref:Uncharacterized protein n=1 Tax=Thauera sinica TaxID=2665146 RepID=A0ABW1AX93_9RHOO|nr:hypothetical protein [Thauera sp. K11]